MFNSETLEVGIGMAFLFMMTSLICTGVKEWIEGILKWRAMDLERAMRTMLDDDSGQLAAKVFAHPLVSSLYRGIYDPSRLSQSNLQRLMQGNHGAKHMPLSARRNLPSYIPSDQFAKALIDIVCRGTTNAESDYSSRAPLTVEQLRECATALTSPFLQRIVLNAIDHADGSLKNVTENLQHWFDGAMDRASGWYKRRTQGVLFALGLGVAILLNVDALYIMGRLTEDKALRVAVVSAAANAQEIAEPGNATSGLETAHKARQELEKIGMPIGWLHDEKFIGGLKPVQRCKVQDSKECGDSPYSVYRLTTGWLITAFAVMLGAPFWFDILSKFMVIRSTVKPLEKVAESSAAKATDTTSPETLDSAASRSSGNSSNQNALRTDSVTAQASAPFAPHQWRDDVTNQKEIRL